MGKSSRQKDKNYIEFYVRFLEDVIVDLLDGDSKWYDIQYNTGLSEKRCKEIEQLFYDICKKS